MGIETATEREVLLADFGETMSYTPSGGTATDITAIFDNAYQAVDAGGTIAFAVSQPKIMCRTSDVSSAQEGDTIVYNSTTYTMTIVMDDGTGMSEIMLEAS
tara:strand:+ start:2104 stop:2409 length:306 start_codon:yes stop_codon:yes gene_type:complete